MKLNTRLIGRLVVVLLLAYWIGVRVYVHFTKKQIENLVSEIQTAHAPSEPVDSSRLVERNGITYLIAEDGTSKKPFTGKMSKHYENGQLEIKVTYKDGKRDGPWEYYYDNGQLQAKETFKDGQQHGPWEYYYDNGQLDRKILFKNGKQID